MRYFKTIVEDKYLKYSLTMFGKGFDYAPGLKIAAELSAGGLPVPGDANKRLFDKVRVARFQQLQHHCDEAALTAYGKLLCPGKSKHWSDDGLEVTMSLLTDDDMARRQVEYINEATVKVFPKDDAKPIDDKVTQHSVPFQ